MERGAVDVERHLSPPLSLYEKEMMMVG